MALQLLLLSKIHACFVVPWARAGRRPARIVDFATGSLSETSRHFPWRDMPWGQPPNQATLPCLPDSQAPAVELKERSCEGMMDSITQYAPYKVIKSYCHTDILSQEATENPYLKYIQHIFNSKGFKFTLPFANLRWRRSIDHLQVLFQESSHLPGDSAATAIYGRPMGHLCRFTFRCIKTSVQQK